MLFAVTAGMIDAVVYLNHGHVFATAMTGNLVLLGIALLSGRAAVAVHHCVPVAAYLVGVFTANWARVRVPKANIMALAVEMVCLLIAGFLPPYFPDMLFVGIIAFAAALQVASFRRVGPFSYNSTFMTGDLLSFAQGLSQALLGSSAAARCRGSLKARDIGLICLAFLAGAVAGALAAPRLDKTSFWIAEPLLAVILVGMLSSSRRFSDRKPSCS